MGLVYDEKSCGVVLFRIENGERLYLILHYPGGHFDLPKGHVEDDDKDEHATARRELEEETGISEIEFIEGYREQIDYDFKHKKNRITKEVIFFLAKTETKKVKISFEHTDFHWLPYDGAFNRVTFDNAKNLLKKAEQFLK